MAESKLQTIRRRSEFVSLAESGRRIRVNDWLIVNFRPNGLEHPRFGWTITNKVAGSVIRNRLKRFSRQFFRSYLLDTTPPAIDLNLVFLKVGGDFYKRLVYEDFAHELNNACERIRKRL